MGKCLERVLVFGLLLAALVTAPACNKSNNNDQVNPGSGNGGPWPDGGGPKTPIGEIMTKLGKGPQSLTETLGRELKAEPPPWDTIAPQAKEYAQLTASLSKYDPPKGSKESWTKQTASFAESAAALDRAADAKDKDAALAAHVALTKSCMACHREHRMGPGGMKGRGGPPRPPRMPR